MRWSPIGAVAKQALTFAGSVEPFAGSVEPFAGSVEPFEGSEFSSKPSLSPVVSRGPD